MFLHCRLPSFSSSQYKIRRYFRRCSSEAKPFKKTIRNRVIFCGGKVNPIFCSQEPIFWPITDHRDCVGFSRVTVETIWKHPGEQHLRSFWKCGSGRQEDFQSSCRTGTMCHHRSLLVSIQAFNGGLSRSILPIRTHSVI